MGEMRVGMKATCGMGMGMRGIRVGMRRMLGIKVEMEVGVWGIKVEM